MYYNGRLIGYHVISTAHSSDCSLLIISEKFEKVFAYTAKKQAFLTFSTNNNGHCV